MSQFSAEIQCTFLKRKDMQRKFQSDFSRVPVRSQKKIVKNIFYVLFFLYFKIIPFRPFSSNEMYFETFWARARGGGGAAGPWGSLP